MFREEIYLVNHSEEYLKEKGEGDFLPGGTLIYNSPCRDIIHSILMEDICLERFGQNVFKNPMPQEIADYVEGLNGKRVYFDESVIKHIRDIAHEFSSDLDYENRYISYRDVMTFADGKIRMLSPEDWLWIYEDFSRILEGDSPKSFYYVYEEKVDPYQTVVTSSLAKEIQEQYHRTVAQREFIESEGNWFSKGLKNG